MNYHYHTVKARKGLYSIEIAIDYNFKCWYYDIHVYYNNKVKWVSTSTIIARNSCSLLVYDSCLDKIKKSRIPKFVQKELINYLKCVNIYTEALHGD
ncbi:MAG: hypothetical protein ACRCX8_20100 [Sarcina sp.]